MASRGYHPYSGYMVQPGKEVYAMSSLDILIDVAGVYWKCRSIKYDKAINNTDEVGTGSHLPWARVTHEIKHTGTLTFAGMLIDGTPALTTNEYLTLQNLLFDQQDEGQPIYFDAHVMEVPGKHSDESLANLNSVASGTSGGISALGYIEGFINAKVDKFGREWPEKNTVVTSFDFGFLRRIPQ